MQRQRDGTAIPSLATEYLQVTDRLSGLERQEAVQTAKNILGSMFKVNKFLHSLRVHVALTSSISRFRLSACSHYSHGSRLD